VKGAGPPWRVLNAVEHGFEHCLGASNEPSVCEVLLLLDPTGGVDKQVVLRTTNGWGGVRPKPEADIERESTEPKGGHFLKRVTYSFATSLTLGASRARGWAEVVRTNSPTRSTTRVSSLDSNSSDAAGKHVRWSWSVQKE
jgi:hypothetical protein